MELGPQRYTWLLVDLGRRYSKGPACLPLRKGRQEPQHISGERGRKGTSWLPKLAVIFVKQKNWLAVLPQQIPAALLQQWSVFLAAAAAGLLWEEQ